MSNLDKSKIQTKDLGRLFSLERNIALREKRGQPIDKLCQKLQAIREKSSSQTSLIDESLRDFEIASDLPIFQKAAEITRLIIENQVVIVAGETGCGKTTQLPKICLNAGLGRRGKVAHTQPRRVAATSVANRIADEVGTSLGELVGYTVRFADKSGTRTRIRLMTDGILLAELQSDPLLSQYEVIIIDEAHERSLNIDFLLGFLKNILLKRPELKLIVTSATIDPDSFSKYFSNAPIVFVEGRTFPVEVIYQPLEEQLENDSSDEPVFRGVENAIDQCMAHSTGDILIFSHGENEIKSLDKYLSRRNISDCNIYPLFARLGIKEQQVIFKASSKRKIIIATNVAETSLTIPNIVFVIDIGTARISRYSQRNKIQQLPVEKIARASADQRKGRCGRICPGVCYRLYSQDDFESRPEYTEPEISRTNLSSVVLKLKSFKVKDVETFPFIQMPEKRQWKVAFNLLFELAAVDAKQQLTEIGHQMSKMTIDPQLARILLEPSSLALNEMLIISSFLSVRDVRMRPLDKQKKAEQYHLQYCDDSSDILSIIKLWTFLDKKRMELSSNKFRRWCQDNFINFIGWLEWRNVYFQTKENVVEIGLTSVEQKASDEEVHRSLICGFVGHLLRKTQEHYYQGARGLKVWLHPSSVLFKKKMEWLLSTELIETDKIYARSNFPIKPHWIEQAVPHLVKNNYYEIHWRKSKGHAAYFLDQSVLGLPIATNRLVNSSRIDPVKSREIFLLEGLAKDQLSQSFPFLSHNRKALAEIQLQQEKLRQSDLKIRDEELAALYAMKFPDNVLSVQSLKKWLKKDWNIRNKLLSFSSKQLLRKESGSLEQYPSEILVKEVSLPVTYSFSPGMPEDGVAVEIPQEMLVQFEQSDFDWLVPGYLCEKIQVVIKNLPKSIRKKLIPIAETAEECYQYIVSIDYQSLNFKSALIKALTRSRGVNITADMINLEAIPSHLKMKFKTNTSHQSNKILSAELFEVKSRAKQKSSKNGDTNARIDSQSKLSSWPSDFKGLEHYEIKSGQKIRIFSGLKDCDTYVVITNFPSLIEAEYNHKRGVARLLLLSQVKTLKGIKNSWPDRKELEKLNLRFGGFTELLDWVAFSAALKIVEAQPSLIVVIDYKKLESEFIQTVHREISETLIHSLNLLRRINDIYQRLSSLTSEVYSPSVVDIKSQIKAIWNAKRVLQQGNSLLTNYSRYFDAVEYRMTRIKENFPKEQQSLESWIEWNEWWLELQEQQASGKQRQSFEQLFWMLQEFRVSLFAPKVKAMGGISSKKLQKQFEVIESLIASNC